MTSSLQSLVDQIDNLLPQTQCGLCGYRAGCLPYAQAIVENGEYANKCIPGGQPVADQIADLLHRPRLPASPSVWQIQADGRPQRMKAIIREDECIGCTKCIASCPVDAIIGSGKLMHNIVESLCTGCELCLEPCPVDCIDLIPDTSPLPNETERLAIQHDLRQRYKAHLLREQVRIEQRNHARPITHVTTDKSQLEAILGTTTIPTAPPQQHQPKPHNAKMTIELAKLRTQIKKLQKQLTLSNDENKAQELNMLEQRLNQLQNLHTP